MINVTPGIAILLLQVLGAMRVCHYNPLSMRQSARWADICKLLCSCDVVGLSGTQINTSLACQQDVCHGYHRFQWGRGPGLRGKPTGCALLFKKTSFAARGFKWIYSPPDKLKGRLGAVRFHTVSMDVCFITGCLGCAATVFPCVLVYISVRKLISDHLAICIGKRERSLRI